MTTMKSKLNVKKKTLDKNIHDISIVSSIALSIIPVLSIGIIPPKPRTSASLQSYDEKMNHRYLNDFLLAI